MRFLCVDALQTAGVRRRCRRRWRRDARCACVDDDAKRVLTPPIADCADDTLSLDLANGSTIVTGARSCRRCSVADRCVAATFYNAKSKRRIARIAAAPNGASFVVCRSSVGLIPCVAAFTNETSGKFDVMCTSTSTPAGTTQSLQRLFFAQNPNTADEYVDLLRTGATFALRMRARALVAQRAPHSVGRRRRVARLAARVDLGALPRARRHLHRASLARCRLSSHPVRASQIDDSRRRRATRRRASATTTAPRASGSAKTRRRPRTTTWYAGVSARQIALVSTRRIAAVRQDDALYQVCGAHRQRCAHHRRPVRRCVAPTRAQRRLTVVVCRSTTSVVETSTEATTLDGIMSSSRIWAVRRSPANDSSADVALARVCRHCPTCTSLLSSRRSRSSSF